MFSNPTWNAVVVAIAAVLLNACAYSPGVDAELGQKQLLRTKTAVGIIQMGIDGEGCANTSIRIARRNGAEFEVVETLRFLPVPRSAGDAAQFELPAGEYHVVSWDCSGATGGGVSSIRLGRYVGGNFVTGTGGKYTESYASFTLSTGEIVNLGYIRMVRVPQGGIRLEVTDLPPSQHQKLAKEKPLLVTHMKTRLAKASTTPLAMHTFRR